MTLASSIITDAYRESNIIPMGSSPNTNQVTEALSRLNVIISSTIGNEVGDALDDINIGGSYDQSSFCTSYVPDNARLVLNLSSTKTLKLDPQPFAGQRLSIVDAGNNLATYPLVLDGNGRYIEGASTLTLSTSGDVRQWMYRDDTGQWVKVTSLLTTDNLPFPSKFDDYFILMLAMRLNPRYGQTMASETVETLKRSRSQLRARYHAWKQVMSDLDPRGLATENDRGVGFNTSDFSSGRPYPWR
jgi:hypothetical protein